MGVLRERADALFAELGWPPDEIEGRGAVSR